MGNKDNPRRRLWKRITAGTLVLALVGGTTYGAHKVLDVLTEQEELLVKYQDNLVEQGSLIDQQKEQLSNQKETLTELLEEVASLEATLGEQEETYTKVTEAHEKQKQSLRDERDELKSRIEQLEDELAFKKAKAKEAALAAAHTKSSTPTVAQATRTTHKVSNKQQTEKQPLPSRGNDNPDGRVMMVESTGYIAMCDTGCTGITATGIDLRNNPHLKVIAVDPNVIPLGSKVWVEGYGYAIAGDTGGAIKGNKIDLHMPTRAEAIAWGRRTVQIRILE